MVIVGLQCGHDAAVSIIADGRILLHLERERVSRIRHDIWVDPELVRRALAICALEPDDIDCFALCTTQSAGYGSTDTDLLDFEYDWSTAERFGETLFNRGLFDNAVARDADYAADQRAEGDADPKTYNCESPLMPGPWIDPAGMGAIDRTPADLARSFVGHPGVNATFVQPMSVRFDGRTYPAIAVKHQLSHAAAAFYQSPFDSAPVLSHDNGSSRRRYGRYAGGMLFFGDGNRLWPIWTAPILAGLTYARSAELIGLGALAGPGKLMGLSAYGEPELFDPAFVGDGWSLSHLYGTDGEDMRWHEVGGYFDRVWAAATAQGFDTSESGFSTFGKAVAATAQKHFLETTRHVLDRLDTLLGKIGRTGDALCLSGGCALNCPTNSAVVEGTRFRDLFIPPSCDDGGLSTGAALYVYHHVFDRPRTVVNALADNIAPLGRGTTPQEIDGELRRIGSGLAVEEMADPATAVAADLAADRIVALFQGRAESGPRALGHRSLLADPRRSENWPRVNRIKEREQWRPFAPACLSEKLRDHFSGGPEQSPHMLFNYRVTGTDLPAVTHVDGTARVQTVAPGSGMFRDAIEAFGRQTGTPVVLNTSFNGPGEPIVDTAGDALRFFTSGKADVLYLENRRITRD